MANLIYIKDGTPITWRASGGTYALTLTSLGASAGRQGAHGDLGASPRAMRFRWRAWFKLTSGGVVDEIVRLYLKTSDGTHHDNLVGTGDTAMTDFNRVKNTIWLEPIVIVQNTVGEFSRSGIVEVSSRYVAPIFWNAGTVAFSGTAGDHGFDLTPIAFEVQ